MTEVRAQVIVPVTPARAFELFTSGVDSWWRRGERYGGVDVRGHRFDGHVGGAFVQVLNDGESVLGTIVAWSPPERLAFTWRQSNWTPDEVTEVEVTFTAVDGGTEVLLCHRGFEAITSDVGCEVGYEYGWRELVGWFRDAAEVAV